MLIRHKGWIVVPGGMVLIFALVAGFLYSGVYSIGADVPHYRLTYWVIETLRDRSIAAASEDLSVPDLDDPALILRGAVDYNDMCTACHLRPGAGESALSLGLYPAPPNLSKPQGGDNNPRRQFWVIKHGIKASGMPAWGKTHADNSIWAMVAFIQKLPEMSAPQYDILTYRQPGTHHQH